ncbi:hypothetical protein CLOSYM_03626 [[Clostridium] symbiosum ATCC 14940]|uniref:Uncharacterized protein n=1 Tax=[Clostridium] symbiosum ATCC 14940 TaxID=411472 RepID=A0ABC9TUM5_CLOSY|nr:hypothetical protein CLOSYM_03626 [[Clostridium] symbiosum ATCC 14940]
MDRNSQEEAEQAMTALVRLVRACGSKLQWKFLDAATWWSGS